MKSESLIDLSKDQKKALSAILTWWKENKTPYITLGGYAGTGKTTLISILRKNLHKENKKKKVAFASFTGKAARVLTQVIRKSRATFEDDSISTIHGLIYSPIENESMEIVGWKKKEKIEADLIIIDEASMVDFSIWRDLCSYGVPIIAVGDHGQLPPIEGNFNLMEKPDFKLEEIHRQAKDNPIIKMSILARETGQIPIGNFGQNVRKTCREDPDNQELISSLLQNYNDQTLILCGYNLTRVKLNGYIRETLGFETNSPGKGDRVICLRNNHAKKIYNGMLGKISSIEDLDVHFYKTEIEMDGEELPYEGLILKDQFNKTQALNFTKERFLTIKSDLFDFGYALTVHKAQGSQAKRVILFEERFSKMDDEMWRRWLYTGITRAEEELFIIG